MSTGSSGRAGVDRAVPYATRAPAVFQHTGVVPVKTDTGYRDQVVTLTIDIMELWRDVALDAALNKTGRSRRAGGAVRAQRGVPRGGR